GRSLLVAVLSEVAHPQGSQFTHEFGRMQLRHDNRRDLGFQPPTLARGSGDGGTHRRQPFRDGGVRHFKKSGMSRLSSSSSKTGSVGAFGSSGSPSQACALPSAAAGAATETSSLSGST